LIVDGRIRVYAAARQVRADAPIDAKYYGTPRWSFRRWPEQVNGVVAIGATVITRWSDGELVALDARTGTVSWRADGPPADGYDGRRTGAATVWAPVGLHTSGSTVLVNGGERLLAVDAATGARRWTADLPDGCDTTGFTTLGGQYACSTGAYDVATGQPVTPWPAGRTAPVGCDVARSGCAGLRDADRKGWLTTGATPRRAVPLDELGSTVAGGLVLTPEPPTIHGAVPVGAGASAPPEATVTGDRIVAHDPVTGAEVWRWVAPAGDQVQVLAAQAGVVHLLTGTRELYEGRELVTVDAATGGVRSRFGYAWPGERTTWAVGLVQASAGFVAAERLRVPVHPDAADPEYYFTVDTVIIAAT
jgi:outer membrane protein assembly factor BamB